MALVLAESLRDRNGFNAPDLVARYLRWWQKDGFDTGPTVENVLARVASGIKISRAAAQVHADSGGMTAGCNPAHRVAPLALCVAVPDRKLANIAVQEAALTHRHPLAGQASAVMASLCRSLIQGETWEPALDRALKNRSGAFRAAFKTSAAGPLSPSGFAPDALAAAVHFVAGAESFETAFEAAIEFAGPANYCPVLVGALAGARWGGAGIDRGWTGHHGASASALEAVADALVSRPG